MTHRVADQGDYQRRGADARRGRKDRPHGSGQSLHPRIREDYGHREEARRQRGRRPVEARDHDHRPLTHTAGISYGTSPEVAALYEPKGLGPAAGFGWYTADKDELVCQTMERLATVPFVAQPGEEWVYGYNTDILGCIVERASGVSLDEFFRTRIFGPLDMKDTHFFVPAEKKSRLVTVYASGPDGTVVRAPEGPRGQGHYVDGPRKNFAGGAGLVSTARDYARFLEMVRNGGASGHTRLLSPRTVALMTHNQSGALHGGANLGFSLAFETNERIGGNGLEPVGAYGWGGAYGSVYRVDPTAGIVMTLMLNQIPNAFEAAFRAWARRAPVTTADVAAKRVGARIDASSRRASGAAVWAQRLAVVCGLVLVVASGVLLWRYGTPPSMPSPAVEVPPVLPDNVVIFWLDAETPVYFIVRPVSDDPGGTP